jgi:uncharacterized protein
VERRGTQVSVLRPVTTTALVVERYEVFLDRTQIEAPAGSRLRVAHISDLHLNEHLPHDYYCRVMAEASSANPDIVFITGDFVSDWHGIYQFAELEDRLKSHHPRLGIYGIFGNHDYWAGDDEVAAELRRVGVTLLGNGWQRVQVGPFRLLLAGCEEPWSPDRLSLPKRRPGELFLVLSHSADNIYRLSRAGAAGVFSGHYHAGQFQLPGFGPVFIPSAYGRRFYRGHYVVGQTHLFVSAGVGAHEPPWRLYCPPDIFIIDFIVR